MYAVVKAGGRQIKVSHGQLVRIDKIDAELGSDISFDHVLMVGGGLNIHVGKPSLPHVRLEAKVVDHVLGEKLIIFKKQRRKNMRRKNGFRAQYTIVRIGRLHGVDLPWQGEAQA